MIDVDEIRLDGCLLKENHRGKLFISSGQKFPLAYSIVESENSLS